jgi:hypothetical protein
MALSHYFVCLGGAWARAITDDTKRIRIGVVYGLGHYSPHLNNRKLSLHA